MNARTSRSTDIQGERKGREPDLAFDDLLDARFDDQGRLSQVGRGSRQRIAERLDPRPPAASAEQLERAVRQLAEGLEAIERHSRAAQQPDARVTGTAPVEAAKEQERDFVTYSLDRLEARLEALSRRLQTRAATAATPQPQAEEAPSLSRPETPSLGAEPAYDLEGAELRRMAAAEAERLQREAEEAAEAERLEAARREAKEMEAARRAEAEAAEARRQAELEAEARRLEEAEARRQAEAAAEEERRAAAAAEAARIEAEARRRAEEEAAAEEKRRAEAAAEAAAESMRRAAEEAAEARRQAAEAEAEAHRQAEAAERERLARITEARRQAEAAAAMQRQFAEIEARIDALQRNADDNQIGPVREELLELVREIEVISRERGTVASAFDQIGDRLSQMEAKVNAARNMAGNRLGDIQDRIVGLTERLDEIEVEIPGFDAIRENQGAILERFDRMEGLVQHLTSAEELLARVDGLRRQLEAVRAHQETARIEEQILGLADRIDALPEALSDGDALEKIEAQLAMLATEVADARQERATAANDLDRRLMDLSAALQEVGETGRTPDLSGLDERLSEFGLRLDEDRRLNGEAFSRLDRRLAQLTTAIEAQEDDAAAEILTGITQKIDALAEAIEAQDARGAGDLELLDGKLDHVARQLAQQAEHLSRSQLQPLEDRLDGMQRQLELLAEEASADRFGPFARQLQEISERLSALGEDVRSPLSMRLEAIEERLDGLADHRGPDPRALQTQMEGIVSRLELLKGRSIDPARLNDLFDRVDAAIRAIPDDRLEQIERLERRIAESARRMSGAQGTSEASEERFARLEQKLEELGLIQSGGGEFLSADDLSELRSDITALRRELRSLPKVGDGEVNFGEMLQSIAARMDRLPDEPFAVAAGLEAQMERLAALLDDPSQSRLALAHIETSLRTIEERLEETRRSLANRPAHGGEERLGGAEAVAGMARSLSADVDALRESDEASERTTKEALDAVEDTLQAVVKRMAYLERDSDARGADAAVAEASPPEQEAAPPSMGAAAEPVEPLEADEPATPSVAGAIEEPQPQAEAEPSEPVLAAPSPEETRAAEPAGSRPSGGLLSRFTSRQLLKRATGGRAESFSPEPEESEEESDFPIEPGTDSPLSSALTGAPSSDTQFMSGARSRSRLAPALDGDEPIAVRPDAVRLDATVDEDFLAAARRAARAAAAEATEESGGVSRRGIAGFVKSRHGALLAAALAIAVAFAAVQIIRSQTQPIAGDVATAPSPAPAVATAPTQPTTPSSPAASNEVVPPPATTPPDSMQAAAPTSGTGETPAETATAPSAETSTTTPEGEDVAALPPTTGEASAPAAPASPTEAAPLEIPEEIGSQRLRDAAQAGDPAAAFEVASRYAEGRGVLQDMRTAVAWYERAADAGLAAAQYRLGSIYEKGLGVPRDLAKAQSWYSTAAEAGNVKAMHNLAVLFAEGAGGEPDLERAAQLFRMAAERGVRDSQFNLAILHARGLGVPQDLIEAYKWFSIAATSGDEEAAKRRDIIAAALPEPDLAKAQAAAAGFEPVPLISEANEVIMPEGGWSDTQDSTGFEVKAPEGEAGETGSVLSDNDLVTLVQKLLADKGFDPGPADGLLGRQTIQAIVEFQGQAGLPRTGQIDPELVAALQGASG